jgi:GT2 family glycosyltransferase
VDVELPWSPRPEVAVLVAFTADAPRARRCLEHLAAALSDGPPAEVVAVDNGARPEVAALLRERVGGALVLTSDEDLGIPAAWNAALAASRAPRVLVVHEDTEVQPETLPGLLAVLEADPRVGAVAARIHGGDGAVQSAGRVVWREGDDTPVRAAAPLEAGTPFAVDRPSSATVLLDRAALAAAGGFDEAFFPAVCVDATLGLGLWDAGAAVVCAPAARSVHQSGAMVQAEGGPLRSALFSHFLQVRAYERLRGRWAARLADHHVARADGLEAGLAAAARRLETVDGVPRAAPAPPADADRPPRPGTPVPVPAAVQEDARRRRTALRDEFLAWLVAREDVLQAEVAWRDARMAELEQHLRNGDAHIEELRAWGLGLQAQLDRLAPPPS